jgi:hypothetical protein
MVGGNFYNEKRSLSRPKRRTKKGNVIYDKYGRGDLMA